MAESARLARKPEARTEKVEDLVDRMLRGTIRVPTFQRGLKWESKHVRELFDSIYRGYPIGSLLFYKRPAEAGRIAIGPVTADAEEGEAWWVVDGQQRLTALTAGLARELPLPTRPDRRDPWLVFFDARQCEFKLPSPYGEVPETWVPIPVLLDPTRLTEWVFQWQPGKKDETLRRAVFDASARIRDYPIPIYLIDADKDVATEVFYRVNQSGKALEWKEVHDALFGGTGSAPSTLDELAATLQSVGMGRIDEQRLLTCLIAMRGADPTQTIAEHRRRERDFLEGGVHEALPVLRRVLSFVRKDLGVPHLRLLPKSALLDVLTRFFALHAKPNPRTRVLLARWFWRVVLGAAAVNDRTLRRRGIVSVTGDEEESVQKLLALVHKERPRAPELPKRFDPRSDESRLALLAMAHLAPRDLRTGQEIDIPKLLDEHGKDAFVRIGRGRSGDLGRGAAHRMLHPPCKDVPRLLRDRLEQHGLEDEALASHGLNVRPLGAMQDSKWTARSFLQEHLLGRVIRQRREVLSKALHALAERNAAWDHNDRPSVAYLLETAAEA